MMTFSKLHGDAIMKLCPKFIRCSAPICPLDIDQDDRTYVKGEPKCKLSKENRIKIAKDTDLLRKGMTKKEWATYKRWRNLQETEKSKNIARLRAISPFCTRDLDLNQKSDTKTPVNENKPKCSRKKVK